MGHSHEHNDSLSELLAVNGRRDAALIRRVVIIGCLVNVGLTVIKLLFGYFGHSDALMADGFHSLGDVGSDIIMLAFVGISFKNATPSYSYGYGKFETFASFLVSTLLIFLAVSISRQAVESITEYINGATLPHPDIWTVFAIIVAMCCKECLFHYYRKTGKRTNCMALVSSAWHHRTDALASIATLIGVTGAHFLGEKWRILDPVATLIIAVFIFFPAIRLFYNAFLELMDGSIKPEKRELAKQIISGCKGVLSVVSIKSRKSGRGVMFDIRIGVSGTTTVDEGYAISCEIEKALMEKFGSNVLVNVVTVPAV